MKDKIAWALLALKNRTNKKMKTLAREFEKRKRDVELDSEEAVELMNDIEKAKCMGARFVTYIDSEYPDILKHIAYPPPYLYVRGDVRLLNYPLKATIVGSREATGYGMETAMNFARELAANNICVVSGGARGIDTAAIRGALQGGGRVICVIGTGIDVDYPIENKELFKAVCDKGGAIVSEFPVGMGPLAQNFPVRNRIMAALGDSLTVVEAAERSGALISASHALEQGKMIFAVPGNIDQPNSVGTNNLLKDGALFATSGSDILYSMMDKNPDAYRKAQNYDKSFEDEKDDDINEVIILKTEEKTNLLSPYENAVLNAIKSGNDKYEDILLFTQMETNKLTSLLTIMEIKGIIKLAFGNRYKIAD